MTTPNVNMQKVDGGTGVTRPSVSGIWAIIAPSEKGTQNLPGGYGDSDVALTEYGLGELVESAAYMFPSGKSLVLVRGTASTAATYSAVTKTGTGTSVITAGATTPYDDGDAYVIFPTGGTLGVAGIELQYSLDGSTTNLSAKVSLGVAMTYTIPNSNVTFNFGAGTIVAGDFFTCKITGPRMTVADLSTALEALRLSTLQFENILVMGHDAVASTVSTLDTWLSAREAEGRFYGAFVNSRMKNVGETEAQYLTAMGTAWSATSSIRVSVSTDGAELTSAIPGRGWTIKRRTALMVAARLAKIDYGIDPAWVALGPIAGAGIVDVRGNPKHHDEQKFPGLDDLRLAALRTVPSKGSLVYINGARLISAPGSDWVFAQHIRVANRACGIVFDVLTNELSRGVRKNPKPGPNQERYIDEASALEIDLLANGAMSELQGQVDALQFKLSRTDNLASNGLVTVTGKIEVVALAYIKGFAVKFGFVKQLSVTG
jgi:hypothetical protein